MPDGLYETYYLRADELARATFANPEAVTYDNMAGAAELASAVFANVAEATPSSYYSTATSINKDEIRQIVKEIVTELLESKGFILGRAPDELEGFEKLF